MSAVSVTVCICTHSPRAEVLERVLAALAAQTVGLEAFVVLLVDNASVPPLDLKDLQPLVAAGVRIRLVHEAALGLVYARHRAARETNAEWLLFVDDDNELAADYIAQGLAFAERNPDVGCFGGRLLLPDDVRPPPSARPFLAYLGIRDYGSEPIVCLSDRWGPWEPAGAGAWVHRRVMQAYLDERAGHADIGRLGRRGHAMLASCDDSLLMRSAARVGLKNAYVPSLVLKHHLDPRRFRADYLLRLMRAYGASHVLLEHLTGSDQSPPSVYRSALATLAVSLRDSAKGALRSPLFAAGRWMYHMGAREEARRIAGKGAAT